MLTSNDSEVQENLLDVNQDTFIARDVPAWGYTQQDGVSKYLLILVSILGFVWGGIVGVFLAIGA
jgi:hypothetical protein